MFLEASQCLSLTLGINSAVFSFVMEYNKTEMKSTKNGKLYSLLPAKRMCSWV